MNDKNIYIIKETQGKEQQLKFMKIKMQHENKCRYLL